MILDQNDPTGLGLFSRCARNQACKTTKSRPQTAGSRKSSTSQISIQEAKRKNTLTENQFARQESREQRQKKYKREITPAVGQYNPTVRQKPKLVWDFVKIYQKKNRQMKRLEETRQKINKRQNEKKLEKSKSKEKDRQLNETLQQSPKAQTSNKLQIESETILNQKSFQNLLSKNRQNTSISHKSGCVVNMSRMTGRISGTSGIGKNSLIIDTGSRYLDTCQLNKSIERIKVRTTKNVYFRKMLGRKEYENPIGTANIYDCRVDLIKPRKSAQLNFALNKGREESPRKVDHSAFSYTHYDYNEYVWKSTSSVFPNTKKHLISFEKQK